MARVVKKSEVSELEQMLQRITDERVRYFYLMLGDAIAEAFSDHQKFPANTGPAHITDIAARMNKS